MHPTPRFIFTLLSILVTTDPTAAWRSRLKVPQTSPYIINALARWQMETIASESLLSLPRAEPATTAQHRDLSPRDAPLASDSHDKQQRWLPTTDSGLAASEAMNFLNDPDSTASYPQGSLVDYHGANDHTSSSGNPRRRKRTSQTPNGLEDATPSFSIDPHSPEPQDAHFHLHPHSSTLHRTSSPTHPRKRSAPSSTPLPYTVPRTQTTLHITLSTTAIPENAVRLAITSIYRVVDGLIHDAEVGDQWLPESADPLCVNTAKGALALRDGGGVAFITAWSRTPQHLTFGIVESAMRGLWDMLVLGARFWACTFEIWDGEWGYVGDGELASV